MIAELLFDELLNLQTLELPLSVVATCQDEQALHASLRSIGIVGLRVSLNPPNHAGRTQMLECLLKRRSLRLDGDANAITLTCEGFHGSDLLQLVERATHYASLRVLSTHAADRSDGDKLQKIRESFALYDRQSSRFFFSSIGFGLI